MQQEKIKKTISWILTAACMGVIFWLSSRTADESSAQSSEVLEWLYRVFGDNFFTTFIVRKLAHCLEFTGLGLLFAVSLYLTRSKRSTLFAILFTSLYAVTDEVHQIFVTGRSCEFRDWVIDTFGALVGALGFVIILAIADSISNKRHNKALTG